MEHEKPFFSRTSFPYRTLFLLLIVWAQIVLVVFGTAKHEILFTWYLGFMTCMTLLLLFKKGSSTLEKFEFFGSYVRISYPIRTSLSKFTFNRQENIDLNYSKVTGIRYFSPGLNYYLKAFSHSVPRPLFVKSGIYLSFINPETKKVQGSSLIIYNKKKAIKLLGQLKTKCPDIRIETN
jgi:hypothetical protein